MSTNRFHFVKVDRSHRTGRAKRGTDAHSKKYHLTYCGREMTDHELDSAAYAGATDCLNCLRGLNREANFA